MKTPFWRNSSFAVLIFAGAIATLSSCSKDEDPSAVTVTSIMCDGKELAGAASADKVSTTADIVVTFNKAVTATASDFTLTPAGGSAVAITATVSGASVTIKHAAALQLGTSHTLAIAGTVKGSDDGKFTAQTFTFKTDGPNNVTPPQATRQLAYFSFNNMVTSSVGTWTVENVSSSYTTDRNGYANSAVSFNGTTDIIEVENGAALFGSNSTMSFWVKPDTTKGSNMFVMGINAFKGSAVEVDAKCNWFKNAASFTNPAGDELAEDLWFNGEGKTKDNGGWQGWVFNTDLQAVGGTKALIANKWSHIVYTYDAASRLRTVYVNGVKMMQSDFNLWPDGDAKRSVSGQKAFTAPSPEFSTKFAFGFAKDRSAGLWNAEPWGNYSNPDANHFKGQLDDVRFFDVALTPTEVQQLYNAEK